MGKCTNGKMYQWVNVPMYQWVNEPMGEMY